MTKISKYEKLEQDILKKLFFHMHEHTNNLIVIGLMIDENPSEAKKYIDMLIKSERKSLGKPVEVKIVREFQNFPQCIIRNFLYEKILEMRNKDLAIKINILGGMEESPLLNINNNKIRDLCNLLGVYIDNAIEASSLTDTKNIGIMLYHDINGTNIKIFNSYINSDINMEKMDNAGFSTKGKNRGHGLVIAKKILEHNKNYSARRYTLEEYYVQEIIIK